jgi:N-acetylmuramoyl-L-alanine amidase
MTTIKKGSKGEEVRVLQRRLHLAEDGIFGALTEEAVKEFQRSYGLVADGIVGQQTWQALGVSDLSSLHSVKKSKRAINEIIVHCSATPEGKDYTVADIKRWHIARGFKTIGYHYVVYRDGTIHEGRDINTAGAHCTGHNTHSIGVCYIGGCAADGKTPKDTRTKEQKESLVWLLRELCDVYPNAVIHGHRDFANKACPSFDATKEYKGI